MLVYTNMVQTKQDGVNSIMNTPSEKYIGNFKRKDDDMHVGIAVVNSGSGKIEAIGAGRNQTVAKNLNFATFSPTTQRQIGSTAKPLFDYGPGMEYNNWSTYTLFDDVANTSIIEKDNTNKINNLIFFITITTFILIIYEKELEFKCI